MTISQIYDTAPAEERSAVEMRTYEVLEKLHIPFTRVDHEAIMTMEGCEAIEEKLNVHICKNLVLTPLPIA